MPVAHDILRNLPKITFRLFEDKATVADAFDAAGRKIEGNITYSAEIKKGDVVKIYTSSTTTTPIAQKAVADDNELIGIIVDNPVPGDKITTTGTPTVAKFRKATVAVYAQAIMNVNSDGSTKVDAGMLLAHSSATAGQYEAASALTKLAGSYNVALEYCTPSASNATPTFAAAMGGFGYSVNAA